MVWRAAFSSAAAAPPVTTPRTGRLVTGSVLRCRCRPSCRRARTRTVFLFLSLHSPLPVSPARTTPAVPPGWRRASAASGGPRRQAGLLGRAGRAAAGGGGDDGVGRPHASPLPLSPFASPPTRHVGTADASYGRQGGLVTAFLPSSLRAVVAVAVVARVVAMVAGMMGKVVLVAETGGAVGRSASSYSLSHQCRSPPSPLLSLASL